MAKISDEIRSFVKRSYADEYMDPRELLAIADRADRATVELPLDRDGVPIHVGDTVWDMHNWKKLSVIDIVMGAHEVRLYVTPDETVEWYVNPADLTHTAPDSFERIADELEGLSVDSSDNYYVSTHCSKLADRIRKLAAKED